MDHTRYRWVIVAAGGTLGCVAIGAMFSLPVLLQPIVRDTGWSVAGVSSAMTFGFLAMVLFLAILVVGFVYEWKKGALEWE